MSQARKRAKIDNYCKHCEQIIVCTPFEFQAHLFKHNAIKERYTCNECLKRFFRSDAFHAHYKTHTGEQKRYICDYCGQSYVLKNNLITHLKRKHDENLDSDLGKFKCSICNVAYCERRLLYKHIRKTHFNIHLTKEPLHKHKSINETWIENVRKKNASVSITKVNNNVIVIKHLKFNVEVNESKPDIVNSDLDGIDQYSKGICDYCKKEMLKKSLRNHIREVHMDLRKFICKVCKESFSRRYQMAYHKCGHFQRKNRNKRSKK